MIRPPLLTPSQRANLLSFCAAVYGLAIAAATYPLWLRPALPGQLPSLMTTLHFDAHAAYRFFACVVALTLAVPFVLRGAVERLTHAGARAWAGNGAAAAMLVAVWYVSLWRNLLWTTVPAAIAVAICVLLRRVDAQFSLRDVVLVPASATVFLSLVDRSSLSTEQAVIVAAGIVFALRLAIVFVRRNDGLSAPLSFALAPLGLMLQTHFVGRGQRYAGWPAIALAVLSPFVLRLAIRNTSAARRRLRLAIALLIYPLAAYGYWSATSTLAAEGHPRVNFFENAHDLAPAAEVLRGEKPYRDVIPSHGLIDDALLDAAILRHGPETIGNVLKTRQSLSGLTLIAIYATAGAATGSADIALLGSFAAVLFGSAAGLTRAIPSLIALALAAWAVRRKSGTLLAAAGACTTLAILTSIDFGLYAAVTTTVAALLAGTSTRARSRSLAEAAAGAFAIAMPAAIAMFVSGWLMDFVRVTIFEIAALGPVYALMPFSAPPALASPLPGMLIAVFDVRSLPYIAWMTTLICAAAFLSQRRWRSCGRHTRRIAPTIVIAAWVLCAGLSYAERHHLYFASVMMPLAAGPMWLLWRARSSSSRVAAIVLSAVLFIASAPTWHLAVAGSNRRARGRGPLDPGWREVGLPRAQGAYFRDEDVAVLDSVYRYSKAHLREDETFFDFTDRGLLYFLLNKDIPIRQIEVAFYEPVERQREVIAMIQNNPWVRCAIVPVSVTRGGVDGIPNAVRAPLVWRYLEEHYEPDFQEGEVAIWRRKK